MTKSRRGAVPGVVLLAVVAVQSAPVSAQNDANGKTQCGSLTSVADFGPNPGELQMCTYV